jgi:hypothetical protein
MTYSMTISRILPRHLMRVPLLMLVLLNQRKSAIIFHIRDSPSPRIGRGGWGVRARAGARNDNPHNDHTRAQTRIRKPPTQALPASPPKPPIIRATLYLNGRLLCRWAFQYAAPYSPSPVPDGTGEGGGGWGPTLAKRSAHDAPSPTPSPNAVKIHPTPCFCVLCVLLRLIRRIGIAGRHPPKPATIPTDETCRYQHGRL